MMNKTIIATVLTLSASGIFAGTNQTEFDRFLKTCEAPQTMDVAGFVPVTNVDYKGVKVLGFTSADGDGQSEWGYVLNASLKQVRHQFPAIASPKETPNGRRVLSTDHAGHAAILCTETFEEMEP